VRWHVPVRAGAGERYVPVAADDRVALVTVGSIRGGAPRVVAVDTATGAVRWTRDGLIPYSIAGDVVVGVTAGGVVAAWDLATGATAWTYTGLADVRVALTARGTVLVEGHAGSGMPLRRVLSARTGELLAQLGSDPRTGPCAADEATLIACPLARGRGDLVFETYGLADHLVRTLSGGYRPQAVCLVGPDALYAAAESAYFAVDRRGRLVAGRLPGRPVAVSGAYLVVRTDTGDPPLTSVYRLRK
jgi:outer membrane protein assembly factor BamB